MNEDEMTNANEILLAAKEIEDFLSGKDTGANVNIPAVIDIAAIRSQLGMSQRQFAISFGFSLDSIKKYESGQLAPPNVERAYLKLISISPKSVLDALNCD